MDTAKFIRQQSFHYRVQFIRQIKTKQSKANVYIHKTMSKHMMQYFKEMFKTLFCSL